MKLPDRENAYVPRPKLTEYLLSQTHPVGRLKAKFFRSLGFDEGNVALLEQRLLAIARDGEVAETTEFKHGSKYVIGGELSAPAGGSATIRTVWIIEPGDSQPRFVTAYPA